MQDYTTVDYHTGGEPFRIVTGGAAVPEGARVIDRREAAQQGELDNIRALLCNEPRGHPDMYGGFLVPPDDEGADLGVLFWHNAGFSTACGHGTIALATYAVDEGLVDAPADGEAEVVIDVPSGRVRALVQREGGRVVGVTFVNVPSYVLARRVPLDTPFGPLQVDISYGGAVYASVRASLAGLTLQSRDLSELIQLGRTVKDLLRDHEATRHPSDVRLSGVYGVIWWEPRRSADGVVHQRSCTVFADGEVDRSPSGSGTSARLALLHDDGTVAVGEPFLHDSILGSRFVGRVLEKTTSDDKVAVITQVEGSAFRTGEHRFMLDPLDPFEKGFLLR